MCFLLPNKTGDNVNAKRTIIAIGEVLYSTACTIYVNKNKDGVSKT